MSADIVVIIILCVLGLAAHGCRQQPWIEWVLRVIYGFAFIAEADRVFIYYTQPLDQTTPWSMLVTATMAAFSGIILFRPGRLVISHVLTAVNQIVNGEVLMALLPKRGATKVVFNQLPLPGSRAATLNAVAESPSRAISETLPTAIEGAESNSMAEPASPSASDTNEVAIQQTQATEAKPEAPIAADNVKRSPLVAALMANRVFMADSIPHLNGAWIYITVLGCLLATISMESFKMPSIAMPFPVPLDSLFSYNFLGLVMLAIAGAGIFVARKPGAVLNRLGIVKPEGWQIGLSFICVGLTFGYDYLWSLYTNTPSAGLGPKLSDYNAGTFQAGGASQAAVLAAFTGVCAGVGEETLIRGGLQPVLGILPAAFLHGVLHGQFQHAPLLVLQVAGWSTLMGIVRKYTNTTTTIITHATFNFLTTFLFAFNP